MSRVRPKRAGSVAGMKLTPEEGFVLARVDGQLSVNDLAAMTGLETGKIEAIVTKLASAGALTLEEAESSGYLPDVPSDPVLADAEGETSMAELAAALGMDPSVFAAAEAKAKPVKERPTPAQRMPLHPPPQPAPPPEPPPVMELEEIGPADAPMELEEIGPADAPMELEEIGPADAALAGDAADAGAQLQAMGQLDELEEVGDGGEQPAELAEGAAAEGEGEGAEGEEGAPAELTAEDEEAAKDALANERNYRQIYETKFHSLPTDARVHAAQTASGTDLLALCFDADPRIVAAILENPTAGLDHVRLIAFHHRTGTGLEMISRRQDFIRDLLVERRLLRNPQCGDPVLNRIMSTKRLHQTYKIAIDRDIPELTRVKSRGHLRKKWQTAQSEERADIVMRTEARCLQYLTGCTFDARSTAILCGKQFNSVLFVQNLAKFPATPPALLAHLMKQPFVRKIQPLKKMLLQHPNMPGEVKRSV